MALSHPAPSFTLTGIPVTVVSRSHTSVPGLCGLRVGGKSRCSRAALVQAAGAICFFRKKKKTVLSKTAAARKDDLEAQLGQFHEQLVQAWEGFHVHVGAGKIGLGLMLPAVVRRGRNFVLLQRPSKKWRSLLKHDFVTVAVNGKQITKLRVVSTMEELDQATAHALGNSQSTRSFVGEVIDMNMDIFAEGILVVSDEPSMIEALVEKAASFSISVGGSYLKEAMLPLKEALQMKRGFAAPQGAVAAEGDLVGAIQISASAAAGAAMAAGAAFETARAVARSAGLTPPRSQVVPPPPLYCCENDHEAVQKLHSSLDGLMSLVPVLVDRVCSRVIFTDDGIIEVATEQYAGDIVLPPGLGGASPLPFSGANVHQPSTDMGSDFLHTKKLLTVNGTHTTLAFLTLIQAEPDTHGPPKASHELLQYSAEEGFTSGDIDSLSRDLWVWAIARQVQLLSAFHEEIARHTMKTSSTFGKSKWGKLVVEKDDRHALIQSLLNGAQVALKRLSHGGDDTGRVLGGGVDNRFKTRLANVLDFFRDRQLSDLPVVAQELLIEAGLDEAELRSRLERVTREASRFVSDTSSAEAEKNARWGLTPNKKMEIVGDVERKQNSADSVAVLFDFDGTLGDTESPAMEIAFWTIAPYLPQLASASLPQLLQACGPYVQANAGKAFEHMIEKCNEERSEQGLLPIEEARASRSEEPSLLTLIDIERGALGLPKISVMRQQESEPGTLLEQQKLDTVTRLRIATHACPGVVEVLGALQSMDTPFVIATTSGKPRVPVCVDAAGLRHFFPSDEDSIHSGESDFDPPRFKPDPDVYQKAAQSVDVKPANCVAVEDSASGVGSAANAGIGFIVGYTGGSHIASEEKESHARMLMAGTRSRDGRGADVVISHMFDLPLIVQHFQQSHKAGELLKSSAEILKNAAGRIYLPEEVAKS